MTPLYQLPVQIVSKTTEGHDPTESAAAVRIPPEVQPHILPEGPGGGSAEQDGDIEARQGDHLQAEDRVGPDERSAGVSPGPGSGSPPGVGPEMSGFEETAKFGSSEGNKLTDHFTASTSHFYLIEVAAAP